MTKRSNFLNSLTAPQALGLIVLLILLGFGFLAFKSWLLGIILSWFGVYLGFWKDFLIILLLDIILSGSVRSKS